MNMAINVMENANSSIEDRSNWAKIVSKNQLTPIKDIVFTVPKRIKNIYVSDNSCEVSITWAWSVTW